MAKQRATRIYRGLTPEEQQRWNQANAEAESEKKEILAKARRIKAARNKVNVAVREAMKALKRERQAQGLSLSDVEKRTGIGRAALSRLENETELNPTVVTLTRYAEALGKEVVLNFGDRPLEDANGTAFKRACRRDRSNYQLAANPAATTPGENRPQWTEGLTRPCVPWTAKQDEIIRRVQSISLDWECGSYDRTPSIAVHA